ncbi:glycine N-acyltransferase-like isoform X2 [Ascaphus truei]|uniref:glycine N-acyltransferase-like isoform X2 n=2 Tax=Ascaphus truei TaxID=8439 RepID=UPI003F5A270E
MDVAARMPLLTCSTQLATLQRALAHNFPESLKVYGALHYVTRDNPFKLQVVVDRWPDFSSVICRPPQEERIDPLDHYTNTYFLFSRDPRSLSQMLQDPQTVDWTQKLQIQGCQPVLEAVLSDVSAKCGSSIRTTSYRLYVMEDIQSTEGPESKQSCTASSADFQFSSLSPHEASIVNTFWGFGGNERSLRNVERYIRSFPTLCARDRCGGTPVAWVLSDESAELRLGYTHPDFRRRGLSRKLIATLGATLHKRGAPMYCSVAFDNTFSHATTLGAGFRPVGREEQWEVQPL